MDEKISLREKLEQDVLSSAAWKDVAPLFARGLVIVVEGVGLLDAGEALARDHAGEVEAWLAEGQLRRADDNDAARWTAEETSFEVLVVQPWVLVEEHRASLH